MQTIIENLLTVVRNISGIDDAVYSNIYDIEQTDKTVFVIIPGDITDNFTAYLVNGSIQLMSKVMLVLKSKYIETNMVITSKDNIKEFSLDNCSGVYNVIKFKLIYRREDCGDSYEGMFVKSINGLHGEVFLDIPEKLSDLIQDIDYATEEYVAEKISEIKAGQVTSVNGQTGDVILDIPEKVSDLVQDVNYITEEDADVKYMQKGDVPTDVYTKSEIDGKVSSIDSSIKDVENKIPDVKDFATRDELNSSIANVSSWVSDNYMKKGEAPTDTYTKKEIDDKDADVLTQAKGYTEQEVYELSNYVDSTFATKEEIHTDYVKTEDYNKFVSDQGTIDETQNEAIAANTQDIADINTNITNVEADVKEIEDLLDSVNDVIKSNIPDTLSLDDDTKKLPENIQELINYRNQVIDDTYARKEDIPDIPDYTDKFNDIDSSISDVSARIKTIEDDYLKDSDKTELEEKISTVDSNYKAADEALDNKIGANTEEINKVSGRVSDIEADYVKGDQIKDFITEEDLPDYSPKFAEIDSSISNVSTRVSDIEKDYVKNNQIEDFITEEDLPDYTDKFNDIDSSIENVSTRVKNIEDDYVKHEEIPVIPDYTNKFNEIDSSIENVSTRVKSIEEDYLNSEDKTELEGKISDVEGKIPTDYVKDSDYNTKVSEIDTSIENVSTRVKNIEDDYVKADDIKDNVKSDYLEGRISDISSAIAAEGDAANKYTDGQLEFLSTDVSGKISKLNVSINNEINRIWEKENTQDSDISDIKDFIDDVPNTYLKIEDLPDYTEKFNEIDSSISDVSTRVKNIEDDYLKSADKTELEGKIQEVSDAIPTDYVHTDDYNTKVSEIDSSIGDVSTRVKSIEDAGYVTDSDVDKKIEDIEFPVKSVNGMTGEVVIKTTSTDYVDLQIKNVSTYVEDNFAKKTDIPTDYVKIEDYNSDKSAQTDIDEAQNSAIEGISNDLENKVDKSSLEDYYTSIQVDTKIDDVIVNASVNYLLKTDYIAPDVDKKYVEDRLADVSTEIQRVEDLIPEIPDYTQKFNEIDSSISDVSTRVENNAENIASVDTKIDDAIERIDGEIGTHTEQINSVSGRVSTIEEDYVKSDDIKDFITEEDLPDYTQKFNEIDSSITDVSTRVKNVSDSLSDYATTGYVDGKVSDIEGQIDAINTNLGNKVESSDFNTYKTEQSNIDAKQTEDIAAIAEDYVKSADIKDFITEEDLPDYTDKFAEIDSSIENVSTRVKSIEDDYVKHDELPIVPDYTEKFNEIDSSISDVSTRIDEIRLFKFPNATIIGEPTISNGQISDFSINDYLEFPFMVDFRDRGFEINFHIYTGSDVTNQQNILDSEYGLAFAVRNSHFVMAVSSNGTSWNLGEIIGTNTIVPNRNYYVKISYDRFTYKIEYKEDIAGEYITDATKVVASQGPYPKQMFIGVGGIYASTQNFFKGMINLNYANLKINNELVWQGMDDVGLSTRLAIDLGNIDAAGIKKLKEIIATEGYIKELPDSLVSKDELNTSIANVSSWVSNNYAKKTSLDSYLLISDAQNTYATQGQLNGLSGRVEELDRHITDVYTYYDPKISNINSSISDISTRLADINIPTDYVHTDTYNVKIAEIDSSISRINTSVNTIENDYLKSTDKSYLEGLISGKQNTLVSGTNIKTINGENILGEGNIVIQGGGDLSNYYTKTETEGLIAVKQDILVSGTNIKTINGEDILGSGNIEIQGGGVDEKYVQDKITDLSTYINNVYTTKDYVDNLVGDINTILESI